MKRTILAWLGMILFSQVGATSFVYNTRNAAYAYFSFDGKSRIKGVALESFIVHGIKVTSPYNGMITSIHADDIVFK